MIDRSRGFNWAIILIYSAGAGALFNLVMMHAGHPLIGAIYGLFIGVPMLAFTRGVFLPKIQGRLRQLPFPLYVPISIAAYAVMIVASNAVAGGLLSSLGVIPGGVLANILIDGKDLVYTFCVVAVLMLALRIRDLIGGEAFLSLLTGRYHKPVPEERVFLFIDVVGSTQFAERYGDLRTQEYLGRFFAALAGPVRRHRGAIDDYVGDLAIVSWPLQRGIKNARCMRCVFALQEQISRQALSWQSNFGIVPRFRAALHGGPVVTAEIGVDRHKITYFGDTVNTTARIEALCRDLDAPILISGELLARIASLPPGIHATDLGSHDLRGRDQPIAVAALSAAPRPAREPARIAA